MELVRRAAEYSAYWDRSDVAQVRVEPRSLWIRWLTWSRCNTSSLVVQFNDKTKQTMDDDAFQMSTLTTDQINLLRGLEAFSSQRSVLLFMPTVRMWDRDKKVLTMCSDYPVTLKTAYWFWSRVSIQNDQVLMQVILWVGRLLCCLYQYGDGYTFDTDDLSSVELLTTTSSTGPTPVLVPILSSIERVLPQTQPIGNQFEQFLRLAVKPPQGDWDSWYDIADVDDFQYQLVEWERRYLTDPSYQETIQLDREQVDQMFVETSELDVETSELDETYYSPEK